MVYAAGDRIENYRPSPSVCAVLQVERVVGEPTTCSGLRLYSKPSRTCNVTAWRARAERPALFLHSGYAAILRTGTGKWQAQVQRSSSSFEYTVYRMCILGLCAAVAIGWGSSAVGRGSGGG